MKEKNQKKQTKIMEEKKRIQQFMAQIQQKFVQLLKYILNNNNNEMSILK